MLPKTFFFLFLNPFLFCTADPAYVAQDILFDALKTGENFIEETLAMTISNISIPVVEGDSMSVPTTGSEIPGWAIGVIVVLTLTFASVIVLLLFIRRWYVRR